ncbi:MAG: hypothetical protein D6681_21240, partial [Calditrichaeota bacterium]
MSDPLLNLVTSIAGNLAPRVIEASGRRLKKLLVGSEKEQAIKRCLEAGLTAMLNSVTWEDKEERNHVDTLFREFFKEEDVAPALAALIKGNELDREELRTIFEEVGYDPQTLPGIDFDRAVAAYEVGFIDQAVQEKELQGIIQTEQLLNILRTHREHLKESKTHTELLQRIETILENIERSARRIVREHQEAEKEEETLKNA